LAGVVARRRGWGWFGCGGVREEGAHRSRGFHDGVN
jgi:hypothetical protein